MKRLVLISLLVAAMGVMAFVGCERPEPIDPTEGQPQSANEDSLINQQGDNIITPSADTYFLSDSIRPVEHWMAISSGYYDPVEVVYHHEQYTYAYLNIYPQDSVLRAVDVNPNDFLGLVFADNTYCPYSMDGDTITVEVTSEFEYPECQRRWLVVRPNDTTMNWQFLGWEMLDGASTNSYTFYLIGVER